MLMWEYVLREDNKHDLSDPDRARVWYRSGKNWSSLTKPAFIRDKIIEMQTDRDWFPQERQRWEEGIRAFRQIATKRRGAKTREPGIADATAEQIFDRYISSLRLRVIAEGCEAKPQSHGSVKDFNDPVEWADFFLSAWFQSLFVSMVELVPHSGPVCDQCCRELPPTRSGRVSKATLCKSCKFKKWSQGKPDNERREGWRRYQRIKRARDNKGSTKKAK